MIKFIKKIQYVLLASVVILTLSSQLGFASTNDKASSAIIGKTPVFYLTDSKWNIIGSDNNNVIKIDNNGKILKQWKIGVNAQLIAIAKDSQSNVYISSVDASSHVNNILKYDSNGNFIKKWESPVSVFWYGIALDSKNNVYFTDFGHELMQKYTCDGTYLADIKTAKGPGGIAISNKEEIYVADYFSSIIEKFDTNGKLITKFGGFGTDDGKLLRPYSVAIDNAGNVYVVDLGNHYINKFDSNGAFLKKWAIDLSGPGPGLGTIAIDNDNNVYLADQFGSRIIKFDANGTQLAIWNFDKNIVITAIAFSLE